MIWLKGLSKISESVIEFSLGTLSHSNGSIKQNDWFRPSESWDLIKKDLLNAILPPEELLLDFRPATICPSSLSLDGNSVQIQRAGRRACDCLRTGWLCSGWSFGRDRPNSPAREDGSPASTALNPHSWEILLPQLSLELWPRTDLAGGGKGEKESKEKKNLRKKKGCFYYGLVSWTAFLRQRWVPEWVDRRKTCYQSGGLGGKTSPLAAASC